MSDAQAIPLQPLDALTLDNARLRLLLVQTQCQQALQQAHQAYDQTVQQTVQPYLDGQPLAAWQIDVEGQRLVRRAQGAACQEQVSGASSGESSSTSV